jgi:hypothetical protein
MNIRMTQGGLAVLLCLFAFDASAQRMRDNSLSPEDSLQQVTTPHTAASTNSQYLQFPGQGGASSIPAPAYNQNSGASDVYGVTPATRFMDGYCDPNFTPLVGGSKVSAMQSCLAQLKRQQCDTFHNLPADVQRVLGDTIDCMYGEQNADEVATVKSNCSANDSPRLQLMRKYTQDPAATRALATLPEDVINGSNRCMHGGR